MTGVSDSICTQATGAGVDIVIGSEEYRIGWVPYKRAADATDTLLEALTRQVLDSFKKIEEKIIKRRKSIHLEPEDVEEPLQELAKLGRRVYIRFFEDEEARHQLSDRFQEIIEKGRMIPAPTFISDSVPFPWEVLYEGDNYQAHDSSKFWGFAYSPARIINLKGYRKYETEQRLPSDMLFCLHHKLQLAHRQEWPEIERLVKITP